MRGTEADAVPDVGVADHAGESFAVSRKKFKDVQWQTPLRIVVPAGNIVDPSRYNGQEWAVWKQRRLGVQFSEGRATCSMPLAPPLPPIPPPASPPSFDVAKAIQAGFVPNSLVRRLWSRLSEAARECFRVEDPLLWALCIEPEALRAMLPYEYLRRST